jgi:hypothetical protein
MLSDYEAGALGQRAAADGSAPPSTGLQPFVLLEPFAPRAGSGDPDGVSFGKCFTARAAPLVPTRRRVQVLRQHAPGPVGSTFRLQYAGVATGDLHFTDSAETLWNALQALPGLENHTEVVGHGSRLGEDGVEYAGRQFHIRFADDVAEGPLLTFHGPSGAGRLFADYFWPTDSVRRLVYGLPGALDQLSAGAFVWAQSVPGCGWVQIHAECYHLED